MNVVKEDLMQKTMLQRIHDEFDLMNGQLEALTPKDMSAFITRLKILTEALVREVDRRVEWRIEPQIETSKPSAA
jgi:hypothetical protein